MELIEQLDIILNWFALDENANQSFEDTEAFIRIVIYEPEFRKKYGIKYVEPLRKCFKKLLEDGYIEPIKINLDTWYKVGDVDMYNREDEDRFQITFKGMVFSEKNGYRGDLLDKTLAERRVQISHALTWILAVSAFVAALYYITEMANSGHAVLSIELMTFLFVLVFGVIAGIILILLITEVLKSRK